MTLHIMHGGADVTSRGLSAAIWGTCPLLHFPPDGILHYDDFVVNPTAITSSAEWGGYEATVENSGTIGADVDTLGGAVRFTTGTTADDACVISSVGGAFIMHADTATDDKRRLWFEARIRCTSITDNNGSWFVGLVEESPTSDTVIDDADPHALAVNDYLGFVCLEADNDAIDFVAAKASEAAQTLIAGVAVPVADTYIKLGFTYNPSGGGERIAAYVNGVKHATTFGGGTTTAANFPDGEELAPTLIAKAITSTAVVVEMDWWCIAQENVS